MIIKMEDSDTHRRKAKWHSERAGTGMPAKISKVGEHNYAAELKERGLGHLHPGHDFAFNPG